MDPDVIKARLESHSRCVQRIDWSLVYSIITTRLDDFRLYAGALMPMLG
jgi:hypothetical protein